MPPSHSGKTRCAWCTDDPLYMAYHDTEWGVPVHDDRLLFEMLILEGAQAGLSWLTILRRRETYRAAFDRYDARRVKKLLQDPGIIRHRLKIAATITNARAFLAAQKEYGTFDRFIWSFVGGKPHLMRRPAGASLPASSAESTAMSQALRSRGFRFVGPTICYAFMQAVGMVNDHTADCFRSRS
jgi:DNA-3-methyladenine glycosylase I